MKEIRQSVSIAGYNFRLWRGNPRILVTFLLTFIMCFLISDKAVTFAIEHNTTMQLVEVFIWNFGDSNSILLSSALLVLLFADMPFLSSGTPLYLVRSKRRTWITGQVNGLSGGYRYHHRNTGFPAPSFRLPESKTAGIPAEDRQ